MGSPTGSQHTLRSGDYEAVVVECGGGLRSLTHRGRPLLAGYAEDEVISSGRGQVLMPWPNRIRDGRYDLSALTDPADLADRFPDETGERQLPLSEPKLHNASHGLVRWVSWQAEPTDHGEQEDGSSLRMGYHLMAQSGYPWTLDLTVTYALSDTGLEVTLAATNRSSTPAPFAAGMHPYLTVGQPGQLIDEATLTLPAQTRMLSDERSLPIETEPVEGLAFDFREARPIGQLSVDDGFTDLVRGEDGRAVVRLEGADGAVELWVDEGWRWLQVYSGDDLPARAREALAVEPMTAPADAYNSGTDLVALEPEQTWSATYGIRVG